MKTDVLDVLISIIEHKARCGIAPSYREISRACGNISVSHVRYLLRKLEADNRLTLVRDDNGAVIPRGIIVAGERLSLPTVCEVLA